MTKKRKVASLFVLGAVLAGMACSEPFTSGGADPRGGAGDDGGDGSAGANSGGNAGTDSGGNAGADSGGNAGTDSGGGAGADSNGGEGAGSNDCGTCDGLCAEGVCNAFEVLAEEQYQTSSTRGIASSNGAVYWASAADYALKTSFRIQKLSKDDPSSGSTLLTHLTGMSWVVGGSSSFIYFGGSGPLERLSLVDTTREVVFDKVVPDARVENGRIWRVEHWSNVTKVVLRAETSTTDTTKLEFFGENWKGQKIGALEATTDGVLVAVNHASPVEYDVLSISAEDGSKPIVSRQAGKVTRLRLADEAIFWIEQPVSGPYLLKRSSDGEAVSITSAATLHDFAIDGHHLYIAFTLNASEAEAKGYQRGIRMVDLAAGTELDVASGFQSGSLEVSEGYLYFFDSSGYRLLRAATL